MRGRFIRYVGTVVMAVVLAGVGALPAAAHDDGNSGHRQHEYLALGDSVPFGFNPLLFADPTNPPEPAEFIGYPELAAPVLKLALTNASCPGQGSGGFRNVSSLNDNGCNAGRAAGALALHAAYPSTQSQLDYAVSFLRSHPRTRLVSLTLGANDFFMCQQTTADQCAAPAEFAAVLKNYKQNLTKILTKIRKVYHGKIVAVTYYSIDYTDVAFTGLVAALNDVTKKVFRKFHGRIADGFGAFAAAAASAGGDSCAAGLLIKLPTGKCDIHPSAVGAQLLADTLVAAVRGPRSYSSNSSATS